MALDISDIPQPHSSNGFPLGLSLIIPVTLQWLVGALVPRFHSVQRNASGSLVRVLLTLIDARPVVNCIGINYPKKMPAQSLMRN